MFLYALNGLYGDAKRMEIALFQASIQNVRNQFA